MRVLDLANNLSWLAAGLPQYVRFRAALKRPRLTQERLLARYLRDNVDSQFGREHGFASIRSIGDFQRRVPLTDLDSQQTALDAVRGGRPGVLTQAPAQWLEMTGGAGRALSFVPYTRALREEHSRALAPWLVDLARQHPGVLGGRAFWMAAPLQGFAADAERTALPPVSVPVSASPDFARADILFGSLLGVSAIVSADLEFAQDAREYVRVALLRLLAQANLRLMVIGHPAVLLRLLDALTESWESLLTELSTGRRSRGRVGGMAGEPRRAAQLRRLSPDRVAQIWPHLRLIACWGDAHAAADLEALQRRVPTVPVQARGLGGAYGCVSIPFRGHHPLAVRSHFFEFLDGRRQAHACWDLKVGEEYSVVVTTAGGLYRCQLRDRVRVTEFLERTPCLRFLGKEPVVVDLCGEKLSAPFVQRALAPVLETVGGLRLASLAPVHTMRPGYALRIDAAGELPAGLAEQVESALCANPHYACCLHLGLLQPLSVGRAVPSTLERQRAAAAASGSRIVLEAEPPAAERSRSSGERAQAARA